LRERLAFLQIKVIRDRRPHQVSTPEQFIETFTGAPNNDQNLLSELYLHNEAMLEDRKMNILPLAGDIQIRAFISFLANQLTWQNAFMSTTHNEQNCLLWIRAEPQNAATFIAQHQQNLSKPGMVDHIRKLQAVVLQDCQHYVKTKGALAIKANNLFWEHCPKKIQEYHPYNPLNLQVAISCIPYYVKCMGQCAERWIGYRFHFPLLWLPGQQYKTHFKLTKRRSWQHGSNYRVSMGSETGLTTPSITTASATYTLHPSIPTQIQSKRCMRTCNPFSWGDVRTPYCLLLTLYFVIMLPSSTHS